MNGKHMMVAAENWPPWFSINKDSDGSLLYSGVMHDVLMYLSTSLNFTYTLVRPPDGKWGVGDAEGNWNGMLGMVKRQEVDFALGPFGIIYEREAEACDFTHPVLIAYWTALMPITFAQDPWPFVRPYDWKVWVFLLATIPLFLVVLGLSDVFFSGRAPWGKITGFILRSATMEPTQWYPNRHGYHRVFSATWMLGMFILGAGYSGTLISIFTVKDVDIPADSVEELVSGAIGTGWNVEAGSILEQMARSGSPGSTFAKIHAGASYVSGTCYDLREEIKAGEWPGAICDRVTIEKILSDDFSEEAECNYYVARKDFLPTSWAIAFQTGSPYLEETNRRILLMLHMGLLESSLSSLLPNATFCQGIKALKASTTTKTTGLTGLQVSGVFSLCGIGLALSLVVLGAEKLIYKFYFPGPFIREG